MRLTTEWKPGDRAELFFGDMNRRVTLVKLQPLIHTTVWCVRADDDDKEEILASTDWLRPLSAVDQLAEVAA